MTRRLQGGTRWDNAKKGKKSKQHINNQSISNCNSYSITVGGSRKTVR